MPYRSGDTISESYVVHSKDAASIIGPILGISRLFYTTVQMNSLQEGATHSLPTSCEDMLDQMAFVSRCRCKMISILQGKVELQRTRTVVIAYGLGYPREVGGDDLSTMLSLRRF